MSLLDYIRGNRKGKNAHRLERESMQDAFLHDAIDGFDAVDDDHMARITSLQNRIANKTIKETPRRSIWTSAAAVAAVVLVASAASHFLIDTKGSGMYAQNGYQAPIKIYLPETVYTENIAIIATKNTQFTKDVSVKAHSSMKENTYVEEEEAIIENNAPIDIFIPK